MKRRVGESEANNILLVSDACFSGALSKDFVLDEELVEAAVAEQPLERRTRRVMTATGSASRCRWPARSTTATGSR